MNYRNTSVTRIKGQCKRLTHCKGPHTTQVNKFLTAYFVALGALATTVTFTPFVEPFFTEKLRQWSASLGHLRLPAWIQKAHMPSFSFDFILCRGVLNPLCRYTVDIIL